MFDIFGFLFGFIITICVIIFITWLVENMFEK